MRARLHPHLPALALAASLACTAGPVAAADYPVGPLISEFLASNSNTLADENGIFQDWIEIHNPTATTVNLDGWYLTDSALAPTKWKFPAITIPAGGYRVVFASDLNRRNPANPLHTNFKLTADGEYLALVQADGVTVAWEFAPAFPPQLQNISYGVTRQEAAPSPQAYLQYYTIPTPGAANNTSNLGLVPEVQFSAERGYFDTPFTLTLSNSLPGAQIRYTLNGSAPTATSGTVYTAPIPIATSTVVRAAAFLTGYSSRRPETRTYLRLDNVLQQPFNVSGWPNPSISVANGGNKTHDYEMDPEITGDTARAAELRAGMLAIPTLSIAVHVPDMWNPSTGGGGFYRGTDVQKPASVELIDPANPARNVQADCAIQGHSHDRMKRSLRLSFSSSFGESKFDSTLLTQTPVNPGSGNGRVDDIVLRAGNNRSFARSWFPTQSTYTEDEWYRSTQVAMGGPGSPGSFVHLYINGLYWGLYNPTQRPDGDFAAGLMGGDKDDWFSVNHDGIRGGDSTRWTYLTGTLSAKNMAVPANYNELREYLDVGAFIDYLLCSWYIGLADWPGNNWWGGHSNNPVGPFRFFSWDGETSWGRGGQSNPTAWVHPSFESSSSAGTTSPPALKFWHAARANPDFLMLVADRLHKHISIGGALSTQEAATRWDALNLHVRSAMLAESARWGDVMQLQPSRRDVEWQNEVDRTRNLMTHGNVGGTGSTDNSRILRNALRAEGFYPSIDPPAFQQEGGNVAPGYLLAISNPNPGGSIHFTLDGSDPRLPGGALNPAATLYSAPVPIDFTRTVKARVLSGGMWSALNERTFVSVAPVPLRISEIMYNPVTATPAEIAQGFIDGDYFEFLEFHNTGSSPIDLDGARFTSGLTHTFPPCVIPAGGYLVLAKNPAAYTARHGSAYPAVGPYEGNLSNLGERIRLENSSNQTLIDFTFSDTWHPLSDDGGHSLVASDTHGNPDSPDTAAAWRASSNPGGSPGRADPPLWQAAYFNAAELADPLISGPDADFDGDGLGNLLEHAFGTAPKTPQWTGADGAGGIVTSRGTPTLRPLPGGYHFVYARRKNAPSLGWTYQPRHSGDLVAWEDLTTPPIQLAEDSEVEILAVPCPPPAAGKRFFRLEVASPP